MQDQLSISPRMFLRDTLQRCKLPDCHGACCAYGVWVDLQEKEAIEEYGEIIQFYMDPTEFELRDWFLSDIEDDSYTNSGRVIHTRLVERNIPFKRTTCIFLRTDHKCALQVASEKSGRHPWFLKPFYCVLHPLDLNDNSEITLDQKKILLEEEKSCLRYSEKLNAPIEIFEDELRYLLGDQSFQEGLLAARTSWKSKTDQEKEERI